jgi:hypothetical protein
MPRPLHCVGDAKKLKIDSTLLYYHLPAEGIVDGLPAIIAQAHSIRVTYARQYYPSSFRN